jgi:hypothetical protein
MLISDINVPDSFELIGNISGNTTDRFSDRNIAVTANMIVPAIVETLNITGASGTVNTINPRWNGRTITVRSETASQTLAHGDNLINQSGSAVTLGANRATLYTYIDDGNAFYQQ